MGCCITKGVTKQCMARLRLTIYWCIQKIHSARGYAMMGAATLKRHRFVRSLWALYRLVVSSITWGSQAQPLFSIKRSDVKLEDISHYLKDAFPCQFGVLRLNGMDVFIFAKVSIKYLQYKGSIKCTHYQWSLSNYFWHLNICSYNFTLSNLSYYLNIQI